MQAFVGWTQDQLSSVNSKLNWILDGTEPFFEQSHDWNRRWNVTIILFNLIPYYKTFYIVVTWFLLQNPDASTQLVKKSHTINRYYCRQSKNNNFHSNNSAGFPLKVLHIWKYDLWMRSVVSRKYCNDPSCVVWRNFYTHGC